MWIAAQVLVGALLMTAVVSVIAVALHRDSLRGVVCALVSLILLGFAVVILLAIIVVTIVPK